MTESFQQVRLAVRSLARARGFTLTATLTLALGIGLSTAVFTVAGSILLRRLPVAEQDRLVLLWGETRDGRLPNVPVTLDDIRTIERNSTTLEKVAFFAFRGATSAPIRVNDRVHPVQVAFVSGNYFDVLGARPLLGRTLLAEDDVVGARPVMVLSYRAWQQRFGGDSGVVGRSATMVQNGTSQTIVGVMPQGLEYPLGTDLWAPVIAYSSAAGFHDIITRELDILARLRPGVSHSQARSELSSYLARADASGMARNAIGVVHSFANEVLGDTRPALILIGLAAALLLFISCVNVANLLLIRALRRVRELVVRSALGASRWRLLAQSLIESGLLSFAGGVLGVAFAAAAVRAFVALAPTTLPGAGEVAVNRPMLLLALSVTVFAVFLSGVGPALFTAGVDAGQVLRSGSHSTGNRRSRAALEGLVVAQIALAMVSLTAAGLTSRSFYRLMHADFSFRVSDLLVAPLVMESTELPDANRARAALDLVVQRLRAMPEVEGASVAYSPPFIGGGGGIDGTVSIPGESAGRRVTSPVLNLEIVTPEYFSTVGTPILRGRAFTDDDREGSIPVVIVSSSVARYFWRSEDPIGRRLVTPWGDVTVVGIVPETRYRELHRARWSAYFPLRQSGRMLPTTVVIRAPGSAASLMPRLRRVIEETSPGLAVASLTPVDRLLDGPRASARLNTIVLALFATAAVSLAALGLFAIIATMVRQRTHELGIRLALGASAREIRTLVMGRGIVLTVIGSIAGVAVALAMSRLLSVLLFEIRPTDVMTLVGATVLMLIVAALASLLPARATTRIDPVIALRSDA